MAKEETGNKQMNPQLEPNKINDGNKLIAEFMGCELRHGFWAGTGDYIFPQDKCTANELKYHESWDWLMPVVKAIGKVNTR